MKYFKIAVVAFFSLILLIGATFGIMYTTGSFDRDIIKPEEISFDFSSYELDYDENENYIAWAVVSSTTVGVTEKTVGLTFNNPTSEIVEYDETHITDGTIIVPKVVKIGESFQILPYIKKYGTTVSDPNYDPDCPEGWDWIAGGTSTLKAESLSNILLSAAFATFNVDVPVRNIEVQTFAQDSTTVTNNFAVGSVVDLKAKFYPAESEFALGIQKHVLFNIVNRSENILNYKMDTDVYSIGSTKFYDQLNIFSQTNDSPIDIEAYVFKTIIEQRRAESEVFSETVLLSAMGEKKTSLSEQVPEGEEPSNYLLSFTEPVIQGFSILDTWASTKNDPKNIEFNKLVLLHASSSDIDNGISTSEFNLGLNIIADNGQSLPNKFSNVVIIPQSSLNGESWIYDNGTEGGTNQKIMVLDLENNLKTTVDLSTEESVIGYKMNSANNWQLVGQIITEYFRFKIVYLASGTTPLKDELGEVVSKYVYFKVPNASVQAEMSWTDSKPEVFNIYKSENAGETTYPSYDLKTILSISPTDAVYQTVKYFVKGVEGATLDVDDIIDATFYQNVNGEDVFELNQYADGVITGLKTGKILVYASIIKTDYAGNPVFDEDGSYIFVASTTDKSFEFKELISLINASLISGSNEYTLDNITQETDNALILNVTVPTDNAELYISSFKEAFNTGLITVLSSCTTIGKDTSIDLLDFNAFVGEINELKLQFNILKFPDSITRDDLTFRISIAYSGNPHVQINYGTRDFTVVSGLAGGVFFGVTKTPEGADTFYGTSPETKIKIEANFSQTTQSYTVKSNNIDVKAMLFEKVGDIYTTFPIIGFTNPNAHDSYKIYTITSSNSAVCEVKTKNVGSIVSYYLEYKASDAEEHDFSLVVRLSSQKEQDKFQIIYLSYKGPIANWELSSSIVENSYSIYGNKNETITIPSLVRLTNGVEGEGHEDYTASFVTFSTTYTVEAGNPISLISNMSYQYADVLEIYKGLTQITLNTYIWQEITITINCATEFGFYYTFDIVILPCINFSSSMPTIVAENDSVDALPVAYASTSHEINIFANQVTDDGVINDFFYSHLYIEVANASNPTELLIENAKVLTRPAKDTLIFLYKVVNPFVIGESSPIVEFFFGAIQQETTIRVFFKFDNIPNFSQYIDIIVKPNIVNNTVPVGITGDVEVTNNLNYPLIEYYSGNSIQLLTEAGLQGETSEDRLSFVKRSGTYTKNVITGTTFLFDIDNVYFNLFIKNGDNFVLLNDETIAYIEKSLDGKTFTLHISSELATESVFKIDFIYKNGATPISFDLVVKPNLKSNGGTSETVFEETLYCGEMYHKIVASEQTQSQIADGIDFLTGNFFEYSSGELVVIGKSNLTAEFVGTTAEIEALRTYVFFNGKDLMVSNTDINTQIRTFNVLVKKLNAQSKIVAIINVKFLLLPFDVQRIVNYTDTKYIGDTSVNLEDIGQILNEEDIYGVYQGGSGVTNLLTEEKTVPLSLYLNMIIPQTSNSYPFTFRISSSTATGATIDQNGNFSCPALPDNRDVVIQVEMDDTEKVLFAFNIRIKVTASLKDQVLYPYIVDESLNASEIKAEWIEFENTNTNITLDFNEKFNQYVPAYTKGIAVASGLRQRVMFFSNQNTYMNNLNLFYSIKEVWEVDEEGTNRVLLDKSIVASITNTDTNAGIVGGILTIRPQTNINSIKVVVTISTEYGSNVDYTIIAQVEATSNYELSGPDLFELQANISPIKLVADEGVIATENQFVLLNNTEFIISDVTDELGFYIIDQTADSVSIDSSNRNVMNVSTQIPVNPIEKTLVLFTKYGIIKQVPIVLNSDFSLYFNSDSNEVMPNQVRDIQVYSDRKFNIFDYLTLKDLYDNTIALQTTSPLINNSNITFDKTTYNVASLSGEQNIFKMQTVNGIDTYFSQIGTFTINPLVTEQIVRVNAAFWGGNLTKYYYTYSQFLNALDAGTTYYEMTVSTDTTRDVLKTYCTKTGINTYQIFTGDLVAGTQYYEFTESDDTTAVLGTVYFTKVDDIFTVANDLVNGTDYYEITLSEDTVRDDSKTYCIKNEDNSYQIYTDKLNTEDTYYELNKTSDTSRVSGKDYFVKSEAKPTSFTISESDPLRISFNLHILPNVVAQKTNSNEYLEIETLSNQTSGLEISFDSIFKSQTTEITPYQTTYEIISGEYITINNEQKLVASFSAGGVRNNVLEDNSSAILIYVGAVDFETIVVIRVTTVYGHTNEIRMIVYPNVSFVRNYPGYGSEQTASETIYYNDYMTQSFNLMGYPNLFANPRVLAKEIETVNSNEGVELTNASSRFLISKIECTDALIGASPLIFTEENEIVYTFGAYTLLVQKTGSFVITGYNLNSSFKDRATPLKIYINIDGILRLTYDVIIRNSPVYSFEASLTDSTRIELGLELFATKSNGVDEEVFDSNGIIKNKYAIKYKGVNLTSLSGYDTNYLEKIYVSNYYDAEKTKMSEYKIKAGKRGNLSGNTLYFSFEGNQPAWATTHQIKIVWDYYIRNPIIDVYAGVSTNIVDAANITSRFSTEKILLDDVVITGTAKTIANSNWFSFVENTKNFEALHVNGIVNRTFCLQIYEEYEEISVNVIQTAQIHLVDSSLSEIYFYDESNNPVNMISEKLYETEDTSNFLEFNYTNGANNPLFKNESNFSYQIVVLNDNGNVKYVKDTNGDDTEQLEENPFGYISETNDIKTLNFIKPKFSSQRVILRITHDFFVQDFEFWTSAESTNQIIFNNNDDSGVYEGDDLPNEPIEIDEENSTMYPYAFNTGAEWTSGFTTEYESVSYDKNVLIQVTDITNSRKKYYNIAILGNVFFNNNSSPSEEIRTTVYRSYIFNTSSMSISSLNAITGIKITSDLTTTKTTNYYIGENFIGSISINENSVTYSGFGGYYGYDSGEFGYVLTNAKTWVVNTYFVKSGETYITASESDFDNGTPLYTYQLLNLKLYSDSGLTTLVATTGHDNFRLITEKAIQVTTLLIKQRYVPYATELVSGGDTLYVRNGVEFTPSFKFTDKKNGNALYDIPTPSIYDNQILYTASYEFDGCSKTITKSYNLPNQDGYYIVTTDTTRSPRKTYYSKSGETYSIYGGSLSSGTYYEKINVNFVRSIYYKVVPIYSSVSPAENTVSELFSDWKNNFNFGYKDLLGNSVTTEYIVTSDVAKQAGKTYFTKNESGNYIEFTGESFEEGMTYYELVKLQVPNDLSSLLYFELVSGNIEKVFVDEWGNITGLWSTDESSSQIINIFEKLTGYKIATITVKRTTTVTSVAYKCDTSPILEENLSLYNIIQSIDTTKVAGKIYYIKNVDNSYSVFFGDLESGTTYYEITQTTPFFKSTFDSTINSSSILVGGTAIDGISFTQGGTYEASLDFPKSNGVSSKYITVFAKQGTTIVPIGFLLTNYDASMFNYTEIDTNDDDIDDAIEITGFKTGKNYSVSTLEIPNLIAGLPVVSIGANAFENKTNITSIKLGANVISIGANAFRGCTNLKSITFSALKDNREEYVSNLTTIDSYAFADCTSLLAVSVPSKVTSIGSFAFKGCTNLMAVSISTSVTNLSLGDNSFESCGINNIYLPNGVTSLGSGVFSNCLNLTEFIVNQDNTRFTVIDGNLYNKSQTIMVQYASGKLDTEFTTPTLVTEIGAGAFQGANNLTSITIKNVVTKIGKYAFADINGENQVSIIFEQNSQIETIGYRAFANIVKLLKIDLQIETEGVISVPVLQGENGAGTFNTFDNLVVGSGTSFKIYVPNKMEFVNKESIGWTSQLVRFVSNNATDLKYFIISETEDNASIMGLTIAGQQLKSITLPNSTISNKQITAIAPSAFKDNENLTYIFIDKKISSIGASAFENCSKLSIVEFDFGINLSTLNSNLFKNCVVLSTMYYDGSARNEIKIPASVTTINAGAFSNCYMIQTLVLPIKKNYYTENESVYTLANISAFDTEVDYYETEDGINYVITADFNPQMGLSSINSTALMYCNSLLTFKLYGNSSNYFSLDLDNKILSNIDKTTLYFYATGNVADIVTLDDTYTFISSYAFLNAKVKEVELSTELTAIEAYAFKNSIIENLTIPSKVMYIGVSAFETCYNLVKIINLSSYELTSSMFSGNSSVTELEIDLTNAIDKNVGSYSSFINCANLSKITITMATSIGDSAFVKTSGETIIENNLTILVFDESCGLTTIGPSAFKSSKFSSLILPSTLTTIGVNAFENCNSITSVTIPASVESIGNNAFANCALLQYLILQTRLIPNTAMFTGSQLIKVTFDITGVLPETSYSTFINSIITIKTIEIGKDVTSIGSNLVACEKVSIFSVNTENQYFSRVDSSLYSKDKTIIYRYALGRGSSTYYIPNTVVTIAGEAFSSVNQNSLRYININYSAIMNIGSEAFAGISIREVHINKDYVSGFTFGSNIKSSYSNFLVYVKFDSYSGYRDALLVNNSVSDVNAFLTIKVEGNLARVSNNFVNLFTCNPYGANAYKFQAPNLISSNKNYKIYVVNDGTIQIRYLNNGVLTEIPEDINGNGTLVPYTYYYVTVSNCTHFDIFVVTETINMSDTKSFNDDGYAHIYEYTSEKGYFSSVKLRHKIVRITSSYNVRTAQNYGVSVSGDIFALTQNEVYYITACGTANSSSIHLGVYNTTSPSGTSPITTYKTFTTYKYYNYSTYYEFKPTETATYIFAAAYKTSAIYNCVALFDSNMNLLGSSFGDYNVRPEISFICQANTTYYFGIDGASNTNIIVYIEKYICNSYNIDTMYFTQSIQFNYTNYVAYARFTAPSTRSFTVNISYSGASGSYEIYNSDFSSIVSPSNFTKDSVYYLRIKMFGSGQAFVMIKYTIAKTRLYIGIASDTVSTYSGTDHCYYFIATKSSHYISITKTPKADISQRLYNKNLSTLSSGTYWDNLVVGQVYIVNVWFTLTWDYFWSYGLACSFYVTIN